MKVHRTAAGKRKAAEVAEAVPEAVPEAPPEGAPAGNGLGLVSVDNSPEAASTDTGPMTKAKRRKGVAAMVFFGIFPVYIIQQMAAGAENCTVGTWSELLWCK